MELIDFEDGIEEMVESGDMDAETAADLISIEQDALDGDFELPQDAEIPATPIADHDNLALIGEKIEEVLYAAGHTTVESIRYATDEQLLSLNGIGPKRLSVLREVYGDHIEAI